MARAHFVKKARKDNPAVKAGEPYWWWQFRFGPKQYSAKQPRPSQLTQSNYLSQVRGLIEQVEDFETEDPQDMETLRDEIVSQLSDIKDECQDSLDNMPESLQYAPTGELLQERIDTCESSQGDLEGMDFDFEPEEGLDEEERHDELVSFLFDKKEEMCSLIGDCDI